LKTKLEIHWQILIALGLAVALGALFDAEAQLYGIKLTAILGFLGELFLRALKMLVVPLISASIITGVASVGASAGVGRLGLLTGAFYMATSFIAIIIGLFLVLLFRPGLVDGKPARELIGLSADVSQVVAQVEGRGAGDIVDVFLRMIPANIVADAAAGEMLSVIVFSLLFGYFMTKIYEEPRRGLRRFWQGVHDVMLKMTDFVMLFAPVGVLGLVAKVALTTGLSAVLPLMSFVVTVLLGLFLHAFVVIPLLLLLLGRVNPRQHFRKMAPALLMAFSTASSSGTLPLTMERVQLAGVSQRVTSFTIPLGATVNMDGTALYECVAAVFIAQAYGVELGFAQLLLVVLIALLTSVGVAGIPAASLVAISLILTSMGLPLEGLGLILAVDRVLDMCRTSVNVLGDTAAAVVIARLEGETNLLAPSDVKRPPTQE
jgi:proton glutamate symport protein